MDKLRQYLVLLLVFPVQLACGQAPQVFFHIDEAAIDLLGHQAPVYRLYTAQDSLPFARVAPGDVEVHIAVNSQSPLSITVGGQTQTATVPGQLTFNISVGEGELVKIYGTADGQLSTASASSLQLAGAIVGALPERHSRTFVWILSSLDTLYNDFWFNGGTEAPIQPQWYFVNGQKMPEALDDPTVSPTFALGDTVDVFIWNSADIYHSLHFHGFHSTKVCQTPQQHRLCGFSKDTWPVKNGEILHLRMVPDQLGIYPVHDHNVLTTTGGGHIHNGLMLHMTVK